MTQSTFDPCLLYTVEKGVFGLVVIQTHDTMFIGNEKFVKLENDEIIKAKILTKPVSKLTPGNVLMFNGTIIRRDNNAIHLTPKKQGDNIKLVNNSSVAFRGAFIAQRARGAYMASICQPEATFDLSFAAKHGQNPSPNDIKLLNKRLQWQIDNKEKG